MMYGPINFFNSEYGKASVLRITVDGFSMSCEEMLRVKCVFFFLSCALQLQEVVVGMAVPSAVVSKLWWC